MIVLLTGERGVGKSTVCARLAYAARDAGWRVGGVVAMAVYDAVGEKVGIDLVDVASGERRRQASTVHDLGGPRVGRYFMSDEALRWGAGVALRAIREGCDLVLLDEIGPLELEQGGGVAPTLPALLEYPHVHAVIVIRPELLEQLRGRLAGLELSQHEVTLANRDCLSAELAGLLWGAE
jgi:nucleoside-triphosphatase THEP1